MKTRIAGGVLTLLIVLTLAWPALLSAMFDRPTSANQDEFEDRPPIIISSGSVILNVARGTFAQQGNGQYRQDNPRGKDVKSFTAVTGTGTAACQVAGDAIVVTYGTNTINFGRPASAAPGQRRSATIQLPQSAKVTARDARTLVIETTDALVSVSNGGTRPQDTCKVAGGRLEIRQVH